MLKLVKVSPKYANIFLFLTFSAFCPNISRYVWLKSVIMFSAFNTIYPSDILSTIFWSATGVKLKNLNLNIASAKNSIVIEGKSVDALHVIAQIDEAEMWIVKNPEFPLICKLTKNPLGINWTLVKIVDK